MSKSGKSQLIQSKEATLTSESEVDKLFDEFAGDKILLVNGKLLKSSISLAQASDSMQKNDYYRLIGRAYNNHAIDR